ncbi:uncharacterized protein YcnI [Isoptericola jiangsuensis]|uniref:Uncharacterized protein YcnI n=1 Tax=Isoptericola jiangsuensis TaxID=548579 RepID=A0A2A9F2V0_9MICO|nr:YcnI family protein [Isoptericola jiangsuensis]PFG44749.1 uncharacterized protein YcnI [Isoptericola jiangsuensis]
MKSTTRRATLAGLAATGLLALAATPALAHVTVTPSTTDAGATTVLRVEVPHGCDGSATTAVAVRLPADLTDVNAAGTARWSVETTADAVTFTTDDPLPDGETAVVELNANLPDTVGATLVLPVVQTCEDGETAWTEVAEDGQDPEELDHPAPVIVVTGAVGAGAEGATDGGDGAEAGAGAEGAGSAGQEGAAGAGDDAEGADGAQAADGAGDVTSDAGAEAAAATTGGGAIGAWVVVGAVGVLVGGVVVARVVRQRRSSSAP